MARKLSTGFLFLGLVLLGLAGFDFFHSADGPPVRVDEPEREFPEAAVGQSIPIDLTVRNPTARTARVIGISWC